MTRITSRVALLLVLGAAAALSSACQPATLPGPDSPLTVLGSLDAAPGEVVEARIVLQRGKHVVETIVPVHRNEFQGTIQVPVGEWELTVYLLDGEGKVHFQSKPQTTQITYGSGTMVELVLRPAASTVHITIDLDNYIFQDLAQRARIYFNDQLYEVVRPTGQAPFTAVLEISPGSYEFKIELYTETFHIGNRLAPGIWRVIHIGEREEVFLNWAPETEELHIAGRVETLLPAPTGVVISGDGDQVQISWDPVDQWNVQGYVVLAQSNPLERFELLTPAPTASTTYVHLLDPEKPSSAIKYVVAAVSNRGLVGYYSPPQVWYP
ncbi:MAG TPA: fibronectin type III domain-containing protein [Limnochordia bacterium]|nr:fibronectin type III domain-containing protein [Limnochordia bacterium]